MMLRFFAAPGKDLKTEASQHESVVFTKLFEELVEFLAVYFDNPVALFANDVKVVCDAMGAFIMRVFMAQVDFVYQMEPEEQIESMVYRCPGNADVLFFQADKYFVGVKVVVGFIDFPQNGYSLSGASESFFFH